MRHQEIASKLEEHLKRPTRLLDLRTLSGKETGKLRSTPQLDLLLVDGRDSSLFHPIVGELSKKALICLIETNEADIDFLLDYFAYIEKIPSKSSLYFCSNTYWYANGEICQFDSWSTQSNFIVGAKKSKLTHKKSPRYFFTDDKFLKKYLGDFSEKQKQECQDEIDFLSKYSFLLKSPPKILQYRMGEKEFWLLRERIKGMTLKEVIQKKLPYSPKKILTDIMGQIVKLESYGFYQTDLRPWNILIDENGDALLIDYGTIKRTTKDMTHRRNVFIAFIMLCYHVIHRIDMNSKVYNPAYLNPKNYPEEYHGWLENLLLTPFRHWTFKLFSQLLFSEKLDNAQLRHELDRVLSWVDQSELRFRYFHQSLHNKFCEVIPFCYPYFRIRYFENRFLKYFEKKFIKKQQLKLRNHEIHSASITFEQ